MRGTLNLSILNPEGLTNSGCALFLTLLYLVGGPKWDLPLVLNSLFVLDPHLHIGSLTSLFFSLGPFFNHLTSGTFLVDMGPVLPPASSVVSSPDCTTLLRQPGMMDRFVHCDLSEVSHPRKLPVSWLTALGVRVPCFCLQICPSQSQRV